MEFVIHRRITLLLLPFLLAASCLGRTKQPADKYDMDYRPPTAEEIENRDGPTVRNYYEFEVGDGINVLAKFYGTPYAYRVNYYIDKELQELYLYETVVTNADYELANFRMTSRDVDGDGYKDLVIINYQAAGNVETVYYFDPAAKIFSSGYDYTSLKGRDFSGTTGFVVLDFDKYERTPPQTKLSFYNDDNSLWLRFRGDDVLSAGKDFLSDESTKYMYIEWLKDFRPWRQMYEVYNKLVFRCAGQDDNYYYVYVNDREGTIKKLGKTDWLHFDTVEEHFGRVVIEYNPDINHPLEHPGPDSARANIKDGEGIYYSACTGGVIDGDWIELIPSYNAEPIGWLKWKENDRLLIDIYYIF